MKTTALIFRIVGLITFTLAGFFLGDRIIGIINSELASLPYAIGGAVVLGALGFLLTPHITLFPVIKARAYLTKVSGPTLVSAMIGLIAGLIIAALATIPIMTLPQSFPQHTAFLPLRSCSGTSAWQLASAARANSAM